MKTTTKQISAAVIVLLVILIATAGAPPVTKPGAENGKKEEPKKEAAAVAAPSEAELQCGVTQAQVMMYLQDCPHHHTVYWVQDIPGTCNSRAGIENCGTATIYVQNGNIIGHMDQSGYCNGSNSNNSMSGGEDPEGPK